MPQARHRVSQSCSSSWLRFKQNLRSVPPAAPACPSHQVHRNHEKGSATAESSGSISDSIPPGLQYKLIASEFSLERPSWQPSLHCCVFRVLRRRDHIAEPISSTLRYHSSIATPDRRDFPPILQLKVPASGPADNRLVLRFEPQLSELPNTHLMLTLSTISVHNKSRRLIKTGWMVCGSSNHRDLEPDETCHLTAVERLRIIERRNNIGSVGLPRQISVRTELCRGIAFEPRSDHARPFDCCRPGKWTLRQALSALCNLESAFSTASSHFPAFSLPKSNNTDLSNANNACDRHCIRF
ncbi:hypothetical protein N656DRAFT_777985 [Canariomyces notabilis]|uniref:Uncharacterized protein n=1 Tax=Canariomyces notabilis TaxID=2074819 RepID=A0AAN6YUG1_9PEZI|nr:hypothetical protein N656DRAFT_777985 [Canariomyces arenarius]